MQCIYIYIYIYIVYCVRSPGSRPQTYAARRDVPAKKEPHA